MMKRVAQPEYGLYTVELRLTRACNLSCRHCSVGAGKKVDEELTVEELFDVIDQIGAMRALYLVLTGGEPLLHKDLKELVSHSTSKDLAVSIDTNGILLSKSLASDLRKEGVSSIQVSIDGAKQVHDSIRGNGSFEKAIRGIRNSLEIGIYTTINFTVSRLNQKELPGVMELAKDLGVNSLSVERLTPTGRGSKLIEFQQSPAEFRSTIKRLFSKEGIKTNCTDPLAVFLKDEDLGSYSKDEIDRRICGGCTAGVAALTISYDGEVYPCPKLEVSCGNVKNSKLLEIWQNNKVINELRFRKLKEGCGNCGWKNICGGCRAVAYGVHGDYLGKDPGCFMQTVI